MVLKCERSETALRFKFRARHPRICGAVASAQRDSARHLHLGETKNSQNFQGLLHADAFGPIPLPAASSGELPGTKQATFDPFSKMESSLVAVREPSAATSYSVTSSRTMLTNSSNPRNVPAEPRKWKAQQNNSESIERTRLNQRIIKKQGKQCMSAYNPPTNSLLFLSTTHSLDPTHLSMSSAGRTR